MREPLRLVDNDPSMLIHSGNFLSKQLGPGEKFLVFSLLKKVYPIAIRQVLAQPGTFPRAPGSEKKEGTLR
jgi:hypothetical protein